MFYEYRCDKCDVEIEVQHGMKENPTIKCENCKKNMYRKISVPYVVISKTNTMANRKESEHKKKVKDLERAVKNRKKHFGGEAVGTPVDKPDKKHIIKKGRTIGGQQTEVNKADFIKAAAKDNYAVKVAQEALKKSNSKS